MGDAGSVMKIGHLRFRVRDLETSIAFYRDQLGMSLHETVRDDFAFLGCGAAHHEIALMKAPGSFTPPSPDDLGFDHLAFELADRKAFAEAFFRLQRAGIRLEPVDNGISWALYLADPDGNRLELFVDTRSAPDGRPLWEGRSETLPVETIEAALED
jgi:catechol 2,3-dioxygenase